MPVTIDQMKQHWAMFVQRIMDQAQNDVDDGKLVIDKELMMHPMVYQDEVERKLKNEIAWCQRSRRELYTKIAYFEGEGDAMALKIAAELRGDIPELNEREQFFKQALKDHRAS